MIAFRGVSDTSAALDQAEAALRAAGVVDGTYEPDAVLAGKPGDRVLRPGPRAGDATIHGRRIYDLMTNGVRFVGPRYFNGHGLGFSAWFECPHCTSRIQTGDAAFRVLMGDLGTAAYAWSNGDAADAVTCPLCDEASDVRLWSIEDQVFVADMAVEFWNWPSFDPDPIQRAQWWLIDVVGLVEAALGQRAALSGHKI